MIHNLGSGVIPMTKSRTAIAFSTKDRVALTRQSVEPLLNQWDKFTLFWIDGSSTHEGQALPNQYQFQQMRNGIRGGSGASIVYALTEMLNHGFDYVGLVENDVLLDKDWFEPTMELFDKGRVAGLEVGAVSARSYEDRVLVQRDGYAVMHNLGAGMVVFTAEAASIILDYYRTQWTAENRQVFNILAGVDIASFWAFRGSEHMLCADWRWDALLASKGLASLALTPAKCQMIGQDPPLERQGLVLTTGPVMARESREVFDDYRDSLTLINDGYFRMPDYKYHREPNGTSTYFAHQMGALNAKHEGEWRLRDSIGYGPFGWTASGHAQMTAMILGPCDFLLSGGTRGGKITIEDMQTGYTSSPMLPSENHEQMLVFCSIPGNSYRCVRVTLSVPGQTLYGVRCRDPQPISPKFKFDYTVLPKVHT